MLQNAPDGHDCLSALREYEMRLYGFTRKFKNVACLSTQIEFGLARLDLCPLGHPSHTRVLSDLAISFSSRYSKWGNIADLSRALEIRQTRLGLCPLGHPEHADALGGLAIDLWKHYCIQERETDLTRVIEMEERWLGLCPAGHSNHALALSMLSLSFSERYRVYGNTADLNRVIEMREKVLDLFSADRPDYAIALVNLASSLNRRYREEGNLSDLNRAIDLKQKRLELCPSSHQDHGVALRSLAILFRDRYEKMKNQSDLIEAIKLFKKALEIFPVQHFYFALCARELASTILLPFNTSQKDHPPNQPLPALDEAFQAYRLLMAHGPAVSLDSLQAVQDWVWSAEKHKHFSVLEAHQTLLNTLDHFTSLDSSLDSRHESMQARVADVANNAFSCAVRHGDFQMAAELLEQGRGILWNQLARFDISLAALESRGNWGHELARKFTRLSVELRKYAQGSGADSYWRTQEEWQSVLDDIRHLEGFSRFLLPPRFEDLRQAAEDGPVIIVNASKCTCDALIVLHIRPPIHVELSCSLADIIQLCSQLSELTRDAHAYGKHREFYVKEVLRDLWSSVVEPIVSVLQIDVQLPLGSRIWWCPTSKFTSLPFHAAGPHRKSEKNLMDMYVSSYAPSLSALLRARERLRSRRKAGGGESGMTNSISFAAVGQARPSADIKLGELPEVEHELRRIRSETGEPPNVKFDTVTGTEATIEGAVQAFRDHRWVHVACHGAQHPEKPFDSWFAMGDGKLTLMRIIQERYTSSEFAFLSACHTAVGDKSTPDEVLHLAAGMQFAGFNGVIGTLWRVDDAVAHQVVTRFYKEMFKRPVLDFEYAATALNIAALETADEVSLEKRIVFVHIGI